MGEMIRLFIGVGGNNEDLEAQAVLEYTARRYTTRDLEIVWMQQAASGPWSGWACATGRTPFTHFRWSIPSVCGYKGRAIYTDVDFFFRADLGTLWDQQIPKGKVGLVRNATGKLSTSCILFDCAAAKGHVPDVEVLRQKPDAHGVMLQYFRERPHLLAATSGNWDCADLKGYDLNDPDVKAVHYTRIETQLHLRHAIPRLAREGGKHWYTGEVFEHPRPELQALFDALLIEADRAGFGVDRYRVKGFDAATRKDFAYKHHVGKLPVR